MDPRISAPSPLSAPPTQIDTPLRAPNRYAPPAQINPNPYLKGGIDTNDILRAKLDPDFFEGYCIGNIHKRMHEATARFRNDPVQRRNRYLAVLYYAQQLATLLGSPTFGGADQDITDQFARLNTNSNASDLGSSALAAGQADRMA